MCQWLCKMNPADSMARRLGKRSNGCNEYFAMIKKCLKEVVVPKREGNQAI